MSCIGVGGVSLKVVLCSCKRGFHPSIDRTCRVGLWNFKIYSYHDSYVVLLDEADLLLFIFAQSIFVVLLR